MSNRRLYLSPPHMSGDELRYIEEAFASNWIAPLGPHVDGFEQELSRYLGVEHGLALSSATAGIHLALRYFGVGPGDFVFCSDLTFAASCNPIRYQYAHPVFIDAEPGSWNMSPAALESAFAWAAKEKKMPKAVIIVDLYGQSADYDELLPICRRYGVPVIEDAAEALGATYRGKKCGSFGDIGVISFNGNKIITTSGGGMVVGNDGRAMRKMRFWATQAREEARHYEHKEIGYNYRMSNVAAGIGRAQLRVLDDRVRAKRTIRERYEAGLRDMPVSFMPVSDKGEPNGWLTVITLDEALPASPGDVMTALDRDDIESRPVWKPMHLQPVYRDCPFFPHFEGGHVGQRLFETGVCLPSGSAMPATEQQRVVDIIRSLLTAERDNDEKSADDRSIRDASLGKRKQPV